MKQCCWFFFFSMKQCFPCCPPHTSFSPISDRNAQRFLPSIFVSLPAFFSFLLIEHFQHLTCNLYAADFQCIPTVLFPLHVPVLNLESQWDACVKVQWAVQLPGPRLALSSCSSIPYVTLVPWFLRQQSALMQTLWLLPGTQGGVGPSPCSRAAHSWKTHE